MFIRTLTASTENTTLEFEKSIYINPTSNRVGNTFFKKNKGEISVENISTAMFEQDTQIICDELENIVDNENNVYFLVEKFQIIQTQLPTRI